MREKLGAYRSTRRNAYRNTEPRSALRMWGDDAAIASNAKAKLAQRSARCNEAREAVAKALLENLAARGKRKAAIVNDALRAYWETQVRTRVVGRILKGLRA